MDSGLKGDFMAIENKRMRQRRGVYEDFDPQNALPQEFQIVTAGSPDTSDGQAIYLPMGNGDLKRLVTSEELSSLLQSILKINENIVTLSSEIDEKIDYCYEEFNSLEEFVNFVTSRSGMVTSGRFKDVTKWTPYNSGWVRFWAAAQNKPSTQYDVDIQAVFFQENIMYALYISGSEPLYSAVWRKIKLSPQKNILVILSDSYGTGITDDGNYNSWTNQLKNALSAEYDKIIVKNVNGAGFNSPSVNQKFQNILSGVTSELGEDAESVTTILVGGGINDCWNLTNLSTAISNFCNYAKVNYPNAQIKLAFTGWTTNSKLWSDICSAYDEWRKVALYGGVYLTNTEYVMHLTSNFSSDATHPNQTGQNIIFRHLYNALKTGSCDVGIKYVNVNLTAPSGQTIAGGNMLAKLNNSITSVISGYMNITFNPPIVFETSGNSMAKIADYKSSVFIADPNGFTVIDVPCSFVESGGKLLYGTARLYFTPSEIDVGIFLDGQQRSVKELRLRQFYYTIDSMIA